MHIIKYNSTLFLDMKEISAILIIAFLVLMRASSCKGQSQIQCNVTNICRSWTRNDCLPPAPEPTLVTSALFIAPSPGIANSSYIVCPVISRWNLTQETMNTTDLIKEARLFLDWLCKSPCSNSMDALKRSCINDKLSTYTNSSFANTTTTKNLTLIQDDREGFRLAIDGELERLHRISTQPLDYDDVKRRIDHLASLLAFSNATINASNTAARNSSTLSKSDVIAYVNNFTRQLNEKMNASYGFLKSTASNFEIKIFVEELEKWVRAQQRWVSQSLQTASVYPSTSNVSMEIAITPTTTTTTAPTTTTLFSKTMTLLYSSHATVVYPSSCFVQRSHCFQETKCPTISTAQPDVINQYPITKSERLMSSRGDANKNYRQSTSIATLAGNKAIAPTASASGMTTTLLVTASPTSSVAALDYCVYDCQGTCNGTKTIDCQSRCGGNATVDDCGQCTGGTTGKTRNYLKDCAGVCNGRSMLDVCDVCEQPSQFGASSNVSRHQDCNHVCFGTASIDRCGICIGGNTGRTAAVPDACGVYCNGDNSTCSGCDNVPNSGKVFDACGVCGGSGTTCTTITSIVPNVVPNDGRNVTILGAGLNGTEVRCVIGATTVTATIVNVTSIKCLVPANSSPANVSVRVHLTKAGTTTSLGPLSILYYDASRLSFEDAWPKEQMKSKTSDITIRGVGFVSSNVRPLCRIHNSTIGDVKATFVNNTAIICQLPGGMKPGIYGVQLLLNGYHSVKGEESRNLRFEILTESPRMVRAKFSNTGSQVIIAFSTSVQPLLTLCERIFAANVSQSFGLSSKCSWIGSTELRVTTGQNASVLPGDHLVLESNVLYALEHSEAASGSMVVNGPDVPLLPNPVLKGPDVISSCSDLELSATQSTGSGGRKMTFRWSVRFAENGSIVQTNYQTSSNRLTIQSKDLVANREYTYTVSVTNFLSSSQPKTASFKTRKASSPIPQLSIIPSSDPSKVTLANDFFITAKVAVSPCSSNFTAGFAWSSTDSSLSDSSSFKSSSSKQTLVITKGNLLAGKTYSITLRAHWIEDKSITSQTSITLTTMLRPLVAAIKGGDFSVGSDAGNFRLDARSLSYDPDNIATSLTFTWKCVDKTTNGNCISLTRRQPLSIASEGIVYINPAELKQRSYKFTVNVTSFSTSRWKTAIATVTVKAGTIPVVTINAVSSKIKPNSKLSIRATVVMRHSGTVTWSTDTSLSGSSSMDFSNANNFITQPMFTFEASGNSSAYFVLKPGVLQAGARYTLRLTANDGSKDGFGQISFEVYETPTPGDFTVTPTTVEALSDLSMTAPLWTTSSDCLPLKYEFGSYDAQGVLFTSYGLLSDISLTVPAALGKGALHALIMTVKVLSACGTMTEKRLNITSTPPANLSEATVNGGIDKAMKAATSGDLSSAVASLNSLLGVTAGEGQSSMLKKVEEETLSAVLSMSTNLPKTEKVSSSLLAVLKKVDPNKLDRTTDAQSLSQAYEQVLSGLKSANIDGRDVDTILDRLADIDVKGRNASVSKSILRSDESLAASLTSKTGPGQPPFETTGARKRVIIKVSYDMLNKPVKSKSTQDAVHVEFGRELENKYKNWKCANGRDCEGVYLKMRSYETSPLSLNDTRLVSKGTQVIDITLSNPISGEDIIVNSLTTPISFNMSVPQRQPGQSLKCVYYNTASQGWEEQGMTTTILSNSVVRCQSTHLTTFAVIEASPLTTTGPTAILSPVAPTATLTTDTFIVSFTLANHTWSDSLANSSSLEAQKLKTDVRQWVSGIFGSDVNYNGVSNIKLSLVPVDKVQVKMSLAFKPGTTTNSVIESKLKTGSGTNGFQIDTSSLSVEKLQTSPQPSDSTTDRNTTVLLATIFGILGALIVVFVVVIVVKSAHNKSKVHSNFAESRGNP